MSVGASDGDDEDGLSVGASDGDGDDEDGLSVRESDGDDEDEDGFSVGASDGAPIEIDHVVHIIRHVLSLVQ